MVGGGIIGLCTAYFLAAAGHQVALLERRANVAAEGSFAHAGIIAAAGSRPWAMPHMARKVLASLLKPAAPVFLRPQANRALSRWLRQWLHECELQRYRRNTQRMQRVARYSQQLLHQISSHHQLDYERRDGVLQLFRNERELELSLPARTLLAEAEIRHQLLDPAAVRALEPALQAQTPLAAALYLEQDEAGNCALFTKQLRQITQAAGVSFHFDTEVDAIQAQAQGIALRSGDTLLHADAVVIAAGAASAALLRPLGITIPLYPVRGYSLTAPIRDFDAAPQLALIDETYKVAITRLGKRIRIGGLADLDHANLDQPRAASAARARTTLLKVALDWFPGAAHYHDATLWSGIQPMLPDGPPLLGATPIRNLYLNLGHGSDGWGMAPGCGKILADLVSQRTPDIDLDGLTLARYG